MAYVGKDVNFTNIEFTGWRPNPEVRGTIDILTSCLVTLALCIWSAVHINVAGEDGWYRRSWAKIWWSVVAFLAPEIFAVVAWDQWRHARKMRDHMNEAFGWPKRSHKQSLSEWFHSISARLSDPSRGFFKPWWSTKRLVSEEELGPGDEEAAQPDKPIRTRKHQWTLKHAFLARMGGFGLHIPPMPDDIRFVPDPGLEQHYIITPVGMRFLARFPEAHKDIPDISEDVIDAASRATAFAKTIVIGQLVWFSAQCITRLVEGLPITLLEVNTLAHAICVLISLAFWWRKPFDVERPRYFESRFLHPSAATIWATNHISSISKVWMEQARLFLDDQEQHYDVFYHLEIHPGINISSRMEGLRKSLYPPNGDLEIICYVSYQATSSDQQECDFTQFCTTTPDARSPCSISWGGSLLGTGFYLLDFVPNTAFAIRQYEPRRDPIVPTWVDWLSFLVDVCLRLPAYLLLTAMYPLLKLVPHVDVLVTVTRDPRTGARVRRPWTDVFESKRLSRIPRDAFAQSLPRSIRDFHAGKKGTFPIQKHDAILLKTAWRDQLVGNPPALTRYRISELDSSDDESPKHTASVLILSIILCTGVYGTMHFIGLNASFGTPREEWWWKFCSIGAVSGPAGILIPWLGGKKLLQDCWLKKQNMMKPTTFWDRDSAVIVRLFRELLRGFFFFLSTAAILLYAGCRLYFIGEALAALREQPIEVYQVPRWSAYWPHLS